MMSYLFKNFFSAYCIFTHIITLKTSSRVIEFLSNHTGKVILKLLKLPRKGFNCHNFFAWKLFVNDFKHSFNKFCSCYTPFTKTYIAILETTIENGFFLQNKTSEIYCFLFFLTDVW